MAISEWCRKQTELSTNALKILAFQQRIVERAFLVKPAFEYGEHVAARSQLYLRKLSDDRPEWRRRLAILNLRDELDLLSDEFAVVPEALELYTRVYSLAHQFPEAAELAKRETENSMNTDIFLTIFRNAREQGATTFALDFPIRPDGQFPVLFKVNDQWTEVGTLPEELQPSIKRYALQLSQLGCAGAQELIDKAYGEYLDARMVWVSSERFECHLGLDQPA
ncbi:hypothetical protein MCEMSE15_01773 [Fimbriimonadaceae bacterium]